MNTTPWETSRVKSLTSLVLEGSSKTGGWYLFVFEFLQLLQDLLVSLADFQSLPSVSTVYLCTVFWTQFERASWCSAFDMTQLKGQDPSTFKQLKKLAEKKIHQVRWY